MITGFSFLPPAKARKNRFTWAISIGRASLSHGEPVQVVRANSQGEVADREVFAAALLPLRTSLFINWTNLFINL
jgi:hypothetical protein